MKAWAISSAEQLGNLRLMDVDLPPPAGDELEIQVHALSLNPVDWKLLESGSPMWRYPHVLGVDGAGTIVVVGREVQGFQKGDRVYFHHDLRQQGTFAEFVNVKAHVVARIAEGVSFASAAALPCAGFTAYQALDRKLHLQRGQTILIHGGSGGVGGFAIQFAKARGASVISTCSAPNIDFVQGVGADHVLDYQQDDVTARVRELTQGSGVHAVLNTVGSDVANQDIERLRYNGQIACITGAPECGHVESSGKALSVHEIALGGAYPSGDRQAQEDLAAIGREVMEMLAGGKIRDNVTVEFVFQDLNRVLVSLREGHIHGKAVCVIHGA